MTHVFFSQGILEYRNLVTDLHQSFRVEEKFHVLPDSSKHVYAQAITNNSLFKLINEFMLRISISIATYGITAMVTSPPYAVSKIQKN